MNRLPVLWLAATVTALSSLPSRAMAALEPGQAAPGFSAPAALAGREFTFDLAQALAQGPVVLYFYPAAFTSGCTVEAHLFAEATERYRALGATVIGVSGDDMETLKRFSLGPCGSKFAVASDRDGAIMKAYDSAHAIRPGMAARISYVISPQGEVVYQYGDSNPEKHVENTLRALREWRAQAVPR